MRNNIIYNNNKENLLKYLCNIMEYSHHISVHERHRIVSLHEDGLPVAEIMRRTGVTRNTVRLWITRWETHGNVSVARRTGRPRCTTDLQNQRIVRQFEANGFTRVRNVAIEVNVSTSTIRRRLEDAGWHHRHPARKLKLTQRHKDERLEFARQYLDFDFQNVVFSDEKTFSSSECGRLTLYRTNNTRYEQRNVIEDRSSGRINVGFWGWMSAAGPGELVEIGGRLNSRKYVDILNDTLVPTVNVFYPNQPFPFVQDNSSVHTARYTKAWFQANRHNVTLLPFPPKSPDINPIENLWGLMVQAWDETTHRSARNIRQHVYDSWESFRGSNHCENMVRSMRSRLQDIIDNDGGHTRF